MNLTFCLRRANLLTLTLRKTSPNFFSPHLRLPTPQYLHRQFATSITRMAPSKEDKAEAKKSCEDYKVEGELNEWKFRAPYKVHSKDDNGNFKALYEGSCHCGRVQYQLSREKPLDAKYCHCTTCQVLHGMDDFLPITHSHIPFTSRNPW